MLVACLLIGTACGQDRSMNDPGIASMLNWLDTPVPNFPWYSSGGAFYNQAVPITTFSPQTDTTSSKYSTYQFNQGYNTMNYNADQVGRHTLYFVGNNQPSNVVVVDVFAQAQPVPITGQNQPIVPGDNGQNYYTPNGVTTTTPTGQTTMTPNAGQIITSNGQTITPNAGQTTMTPNAGQITTTS